MNSRALFVTGLMGLSLTTFVWGCNGEDGVGPEQRGTYETALFGTFRGITASYSTGGTTGTLLSLDTTSYIRINKSDSSYSIRVSGTDKATRTMNFLFEESGYVTIANVTYTPIGGSVYTAHWDGYLGFFPLPNLKHSPWSVNFVVSDIPSSHDRLGVQGGGYSSIFLAQNSYLWLLGWRKEYYPY